MSKKDVSIAVIGCGWLGLPFAKKMVVNNYQVKGSSTRHDKLGLLIDNGIDPYLLKLPSREEIPGALFDVDILLINIPPGRSNPDSIKNYARTIEVIIDHVKKSERLRQMIFISSTSVYGAEGDVISETMVPRPETESGEVIYNSELAIRESGKPFTILRFGGLVGPNRHPGNFLAGKSGIRSGHQSVNLLHLTDAIRVIEHMMAHQPDDQIFNVVAPIHPSKELFYVKMANMLNLQPPTFEESQDRSNKEISVDKLISHTGFEFIYPDPMEFEF